MVLSIGGKIVFGLVMVTIFGAVGTAQAEPRRHDDRGRQERGQDDERHQRLDRGPEKIRDYDRRVIVNYINVDYSPNYYSGHDYGRGRGHDKHSHYDRHGPSYMVGKRLPDTVQWRPIPRDLYVRLKPVPVGYRYVQVDSDVLLMSEATRMIIDAVTLLSAVNTRN